MNTFARLTQEIDMGNEMKMERAYCACRTSSGTNHTTCKPCTNVMHIRKSVISEYPEAVFDFQCTLTLMLTPENHFRFRILLLDH